jgi:hypothetical protein
MAPGAALKTSPSRKAAIRTDIYILNLKHQLQENAAHLLQMGRASEPAR